MELCPHCRKVTPSRTVRHASGTEFLCTVCGAQVDFLHDEEAEWQDEFVANDFETPFSDLQATLTDDDLEITRTGDANGEEKLHRGGNRTERRPLG